MTPPNDDIDTEDELRTIELPVGPGANSSIPSLIVMHGPNIGSHFTLEKSEAYIGRSSDVEIVVNEDNVSRRHAVLAVGDSSVRLKDLGSTNGTFVNEERITDIELRDGDLIQVGDSVLKFLSGSNIESQYHEDIYRMSTVDALTQVYNQRFFMTALNRELNRSQRHTKPLCIALLDLDHFKRVNDTHGHVAGDFVLMQLARIISDSIRQEDVFARYGGEEFAMILPETRLDGARAVCEKLRRKVAEEAFSFEGTKIEITISIGVAEVPSADRTTEPSAIIAAADQRLYEAKESGRNRVCA